MKTENMGSKKVIKLSMTELFAGIGAQTRAKNNLLKNKDILKQIIGDCEINFNVVAISEWDIKSIISNDLLNNGLQETFPNYDNLEKAQMLEFLDQFTLSKDGSKPCDKAYIHKFKFEKIRELYIAMKRTRNLGSIMDIKGVDLPHTDVMTYSFPCTDLSLAGNCAGLEIGTRSGLLWEVKRILEELNSISKLPKFLIMENVEALLFKKNIEKWTIFTNYLEQLGYKNTTMVLNAQDFGVTQHRKRAFCISVLGGTKEVEVTKVTRETNLIDFLKLNDVNSTNKYINEYKDAMPKLTPSRIKYIEKCKTINDNGNCMTITTKQDRAPNAGLLFCDENGLLSENRTDININGDYAPYRFLTAREQLMLMGFNENDFDKLNAKGISKATIEKQAGNSIVVQILEAIFTSIIKMQIMENEIFTPINNTEYIIDENDNFIAVPNIA